VEERGRAWKSEEECLNTLTKITDWQCGTCHTPSAMHTCVNAPQVHLAFLLLVPLVVVVVIISLGLMIFLLVLCNLLVFII
jgi:hypothetical protein